jgi:hypothetical protein
VSKLQKLMKTMQCLLLVFILSGCKGALIGDLVAKPGQALYHDDFSDPGSGWPQATSAKGILGYDQGAYRMQVLSPGYDLRAVPGQFFSDVQIEVDTTRVSGPVYNQFGVTCRFQDLNNFYFFVISSDGYYAIGKIKDGVTTLLGQEMMAYTSTIRQGSVPNHLRFDCILKSLKGFVNGQAIAITEDADFSRGDAGIISGAFTEGGVDVSFDNFVVYKP